MWNGITGSGLAPTFKGASLRVTVTQEVFPRVLGYEGERLDFSGPTGLASDGGKINFDRQFRAEAGLRR